MPVKPLGNLIGKQINSLCVISKLSRISGKDRYLCLCDCGNELIVYGFSLRSKSRKACLRCTRKVESDISGFKRVKANYVNSAKIRSLEFELTDLQIKELIEGNCIYCGLKATEGNAVTLQDGRVYRYNGIDRMNNSMGYVEFNTYSCCWVCNKMKGTMPHEDFLAQVILIMKYHLNG